MANLKELRLRIGAVKNTRKITSAMSQIATARLRKAQNAALAARPYGERLQEVVSHLVGGIDPAERSAAHPLLEQRTLEDGDHTLYIAMTADKGLCGGFNSNIIRKTAQYLKDNTQNENSLIIAGKKGNDVFRNRPVTITQDIIGWTKDFDYLKAQAIGENLAALFTEKKIDRVFMVYNEFKSVMQQEIVVEQLLPVVPEKMARKDETFIVDYIYEPDEETILDKLLKRYMTVEVYRAFLESSASEHGARMTAMDSATRNAGEMIDGLSLTYNKARQAYITKELIEIVNGAEALKG